MEATREEVLSICKAIRESFMEAAIIYTEGHCFGFHLILKSIYPDAVPYCDDGHVATKIGENLYDVIGVIERPENFHKMNDEEQYRWEAYRHAKTARYIINKTEAVGE